jgi:hypothetical protein
MTVLRANARPRGVGVACLVAVLMIAVFCLFGCGGDDDDDSAARTTTTDSRAAAPTETRAEPADRAADRRIAEDAVLVLEDFPTGWQQEDEDDDDNEETDCSGVRDARETLSARATSPRFSQGETKNAENVTYVYGDDPAARTAFAGLASSETRTCIGQDLGERLAEAAGPTGQGGGTQVGEPETSRVSIELLGDEREAARITVPVSAEGIDVDLIIDLVFVRVGRGIALVTVTDALTPFDEDLKAELTSTVIRRLSAALE